MLWNVPEPALFLFFFQNIKPLHYLSQTPQVTNSQHTFKKNINNSTDKLIQSYQWKLQFILQNQGFRGREAIGSKYNYP